MTSTGTSKQTGGMGTYGTYGRFLCYLSTLSLLSITSRHLGEDVESTLGLYASQVISRLHCQSQEQRTLREAIGTKVTVHNLFGSMPVRVKHRAVLFQDDEKLEKELENLKNSLVALLLAWSRPLKLKLFDAATSTKWQIRLCPGNFSYTEETQPGTATDRIHFRLDWIGSLLAQAEFVARSSLSSWVTASACTPLLYIRAAISLEPAPTKRVQFISIGKWPIHRKHDSSLLFDEVNRMFALSGFGAAEDDVDISEEERQRRSKDRRFKVDEHTMRQLRGLGRGVDRWPMFYIRITTKTEECLSGLMDSSESVGEADQFLHKILDLLHTLLRRFLEEHNFRPSARRRTRSTLRMAMPHNDSSVSDEQQEGLRSVVDSSKLSRQLASSEATAQSHRPISQRAATGGPFEQWSRIKSGSIRGLEGLLRGLPGSKGLAQVESRCDTPSSISQDRESKISLGLSALAQAESRAILEDDIQVLLRDLEDDDLSIATDPSVAESEGSSTNVSSSESNDLAEAHNGNATQEPVDRTRLWANPSTGKAVRINSRTGLVLPCTEGESGNQQSSLAYPPHLIDPQPTRARLTLRKKDQLSLRVAPESWIGNLLKDSSYATFYSIETAIPSATREDESLMNAAGHHCAHFGAKNSTSLFAQSSSSEAARVSKSGLALAEVLAQVDQKFILAIASDGPFSNSQTDGRSTLVLIDQHAADERIQVEEMYRILCRGVAQSLPKVIRFETTSQDARIFEKYKDYWAAWGFHYSVQQVSQQPLCPPSSLRPINRAKGPHVEDQQLISVSAVAEVVAERCRLEPRLLINMLRDEVWRREDDLDSSRGGPSVTRAEASRKTAQSVGWLERISNCPGRLLEMVNSRACRSAIMFNDVLSLDECKRLVGRLSESSFPFQCAHGRPSMVVLGGLDKKSRSPSGGLGSELLDQESQRSFHDAFRTWAGSSG